MLACPPISVPDDLSTRHPAHSGTLPALDHLLNVSGLRHMHSRQFSPADAPADTDWASVVRAAQFPASCSRLLLLEDDMSGAGVGMTARLTVAALLLAMRESRVLLEVPVNGSWSHRNAHIAGSKTPRWCGAAPFTWRCFYRPWTHCSLPAPGIARVHTPRGPWPPARRRPVTQVKLSWIYAQGRMLYQHDVPGSEADRRIPRALSRAAYAHLWGNPRPWVRAQGQCLLRGLQKRGQFQTVHVRDSVEKRAEQKRLLPGGDVYAEIARGVAFVFGLDGVLLQTASPGSLASFVGEASRDERLRTSHSDNPRSEHDTWGGLRGNVTLDSAVAAVNAWVGSHASAFLSLKSSTWTIFQAKLMEATGGEPLSNVTLACKGVGASQKGLHREHLKLFVRRSVAARARRRTGDWAAAVVAAMNRSHTACAVVVERSRSAAAT